MRLHYLPWPSFANAATAQGPSCGILGVSHSQARVIGLNPHCPRRRFGTFPGLASSTVSASRLVMAGVDLRTVQELMGHKSIEMTVRYSHLTPKHTLAAVQRLTATDLTNSTGTRTTT